MMTLFALILLSLSFTPQPQAAAVRVAQPGVEIRLYNTEQWIALPENAVTPLAMGDQLRTDGSGRAYITFGEQAEVILLSDSIFLLTEFETDSSGTAVFAASIPQGIGLHRINQGRYHLQLNDFNLTSDDTGAGSIFGIWAFASEPDTIIVQSGQVSVFEAEVPLKITAGEGIRHGFPPTAMQPPYNAARLEAQLDSCTGIVQAENAPNLIVRRSAGQGYEPLTSLENGLEVALVGITESGFWTRIQVLTGFGWVQSLALESNCTDLTIYDDEPPQEFFTSIVNVTDDELALFESFFGSPLVDGYTYQFIESNP